MKKMEKISKKEKCMQVEKNYKGKKNLKKGCRLKSKESFFFLFQLCYRRDRGHPPHPGAAEQRPVRRGREAAASSVEHPVAAEPRRGAPVRQGEPPPGERRPGEPPPGGQPAPGLGEARGQRRTLLLAHQERHHPEGAARRGRALRQQQE